MMITTERVEKLGNYLKADPVRAKALLEMDAEAALEKINADGNDFTVEELKAFDELMVNAAADNGELGENELETVAGGISVASAILVVKIVKFGAPYAWRAGQWLGKKICGK